MNNKTKIDLSKIQALLSTPIAVDKGGRGLYTDAQKKEVVAALQAYVRNDGTAEAFMAEHGLSTTVYAWRKQLGAVSVRPMPQGGIHGKRHYYSLPQKAAIVAKFDKHLGKHPKATAGDAAAQQGFAAWQIRNFRKDLGQPVPSGRGNGRATSSPGNGSAALAVRAPMAISNKPAARAKIVTQHLDLRLGVVQRLSGIGRRLHQALGEYLDLNDDVLAGRV